MKALDKVSLAIIAFYRANLSAYKGFRCAHGVKFGGDSCSDAILKIIQRRGLLSGYADIKQQFARCSNAHAHLQHLASTTPNKNRNKKKKKKKKDKTTKRECLEHFTCEAAANCVPNILCKGDKSSGCDLPCDCSP